MDILIYYVYAYINKRTGLPYYIGKGKDKRAYNDHGYISVPKDKSKIVFLETNLTELGAFALERRYIRWYGRKKIDEGGILLNRTEGGEGATGYQHPNTARANISRIENGTHPFLNYENRQKVNGVNKKRIEDGIHPWLGGEIQKATANRRVLDGTNPFVVKVTCEHCGKTLDKGNYGRYHGKKCKTQSSISSVQYLQ